MSDTPTVTAVDFISIPTQDLPRAVAFYRDALGLPCSALYQRGADSPAIGAEFKTGNVTLSVITSAAVGMTFAPLSAPIALRVDDVETARAELESRGVSFGAPTMDTTVCHMAHFQDPDGNPLMLHHRYAAPNPVPDAERIEQALSPA
jgi:predicted enzyme related to lactoylglutathione lyase